MFFVPGPGGSLRTSPELSYDVRNVVERPKLILICLSRITKISTGMCVFRVCLLLTGHSRWPPAPCWLTMRFHPDLSRSYFPRGVTSGIDGRLTCPEAEKSSDPTAFCAEETTFFSLQGFFPRFSHLALRTRSQISLAIFCSLFAMAAGNE